jgi:hypothetical protein
MTEQSPSKPKKTSLPASRCYLFDVIVKKNNKRSPSLAGAFDIMPYLQFTAGSPVGTYTRISDSVLGDPWHQMTMLQQFICNSIRIHSKDTVYHL